MNDLNDLSSILAICLSALTVVAIWSDIRSDLSRLISGRNVVILAINAWYMLEAIMLPDALRRYSQEQYNAGLFYVALAFASFLVGYHYTAGCAILGRAGDYVAFFDDDKWLWRLVLCGAVIGFTPVVYYTGTHVGEMLQGMMGMRSTWGGLLGRGRFGDARAAFLMLEMFVGAVAPFATILLFKRNTPVLQRVFCVLVVAWPIARGFGNGTRNAFISAAAVLAAFAFWKSSVSTRKKLIIAVFACLPLLYGFMAAVVISRGSGEFSWESRKKADYVGNEMFRELLFISSKVPNEVNYQFGYVYYVQLVNPIPRFLWPEKPTLDTGLLMADLYGQVDARGNAYLTISPGLIGEMYLNFGILGVIGLSYFGGWLVKGWDLIVTTHSHSLPAMMYYSGGLAVLFFMGRSFNLNMFYGLLSLALLAWLIRFFNPHAVASVPATAAANPGS